MNKPLIKQGWLRAIIFMVTYIVTLTIVGFIAFGIWAIFQEKGMASHDKFQTAAGTNLWFTVIINMVSAILSVFFSRKYIDKQSFMSLGFKWDGFKNHALTGLFGAITMLGLGTIILVLLKYLWDILCPLHQIC